MARRGEALLLAACVAAGLVFFASLDRLWPLVPIDLVVPPAETTARATRWLAERGFDVAAHSASAELTVRENELDYVQRAFGSRRTAEWIGRGLPLAYYVVHFKKRGERTIYGVEVHPSAGVLGWRRSVEEDEPAPSIDLAAARELALQALRDLACDPRDFVERQAASTEQIARRDHAFRFERSWSAEPELREWVQVSVAGPRVVAASRSLIVPAAERRARLAAAAPAIALETLGFALLALATIGALGVFLARLRDGTAELARAARWPLVVLVCLLGTWSLERTELFLSWEPLWPPWISHARYLVLRAMEGAWLVVALLALVGAGDAIDRAGGAGRGVSLWLAGRGRLAHPAVGLASMRGFLIGLLCGGTLAAAVRILQSLAGASTALQPRGFFFYTLNTASPLATSLLFFLGVALIEELGYRYFGGAWIEQLTGRRWLAVLVPAAIYGLTHTRMGFLPPAEPFWARPLVLALVGAVWGWAFFRYDALTVVLSHFTADLFIFNWPRLASGEPWVVGPALLTVAAPLVPALASLVWGRRGRRLGSTSG